MEIFIQADKKEYFKCSMYYFRKFFGLREIILLSVLLILGILLTVFSQTYFVLILFGVCVLIILFAFVLFIWTAKSGYKIDFEKQGITRQKLFFAEDAIYVTNFDKGGTPVFSETHSYDKIDKIAIRKDAIYIYAKVSVFYHILASSLDKEQRTRLVDLLHERIKDETVFKMKKTYRIYPKKKKITLEPDDSGKRKDS